LEAGVAAGVGAGEEGVGDEAGDFSEDGVADESFPPSPESVVAGVDDSLGTDAEPPPDRLSVL
jgi:hypothetical protein